MVPAGDNRRLCLRCRKHVHFLSGMSEVEARQRLSEGTPGDSLCVRYLATRDGTVVFVEPTPIRARVMAAGLAAMMLVGCKGTPTSEELSLAEVAAPPLWVEAPPVIPDLALPPEPEQVEATAEPPKSKRSQRRQKRLKIEPFMGESPL